MSLLDVLYLLILKKIILYISTDYDNIINKISNFEVNYNFLGGVEIYLTDTNAANLPLIIL